MQATEQTTRQIGGEIEQTTRQMGGEIDEPHDIVVGLIRQAIETVEDTTGQVIAGEITIHGDVETMIENNDETRPPTPNHNTNQGADE